MPPEEKDPLVAADSSSGEAADTRYEDYGCEDAVAERPTARRGSSVRFENIDVDDDDNDDNEAGAVVDYGYEDARPTTGRRRSSSSSVRFPPTLKKLDMNQPVRRSVVRRESFIVQFAKTKGPPQITFIMMLIAIGLGSTIGVVPAVMTDRFARLNHGYDDDADCSSYDASEEEKPQACYMGSADAQTAVATSNLISNSLTFLTSSLIGSLSDEHGRRGILILGVVFSTLPPFMLFLIQLYPTMSPWVYYVCHASTGLVNWMAVALSSLADVLPQKFRAPGIGLLMAGFMLGFSLAPIFAFVFNQIQLSFVSFCVVLIGLFSTIFFVPETLQPQVAEEARRRRQDTTSTNNNGQRPSLMQRIIKFLVRPIKEMSILNRNNFFRLVSLLAFFSGMVTSGDQLLLVYYVEERLGFTAQDVSIMFLIMGTMGLMVQALLLKPLNECVGEKMVVAICFFVGAVDNTMYGLAQNKATIYAAIALSSITMMAFPTISAIKANNVDVTEQGRIQGALYSLQALASGVGPILLRFVYGKFKETSLGPGAMFVFAGMLYLVAVAAACALPKELANSKRGDDDEDDITDESDEGDDILDMTDHDESTEFDLSEKESYGAVVAEA